MSAKENDGGSIHSSDRSGRHSAKITSSASDSKLSVESSSKRKYSGNKSSTKPDHEIKSGGRGTSNNADRNAAEERTSSTTLGPEGDIPLTRPLNLRNALNRRMTIDSRNLTQMEISSDTDESESELSSSFKKYHSKGSIRAEKKKKSFVDKLVKGSVHAFMYEYCESKTFNNFIRFVILVNTASLCAETWEIVRVRLGWYLDVTENIFLGIYIMEAVVKIYVWRRLYFKDNWNVLDFIILVFNLIDYILPMVVQNVQGFDGAAIFRMLRILRGIRAIRAFRVLRTIKFLSNLTVIMNTCLQSVQSMGAIFMLMMLFMYMFAVIGRGLYAKKDPERFGSLTTTVFTLFQLLTLDEWFDIYENMVEKSPDDWPIIIYLILYIVLEHFIFFNLFVAVLVDNFQLTLEAANEAKANSKYQIDSDDEEDRIESDCSSDVTGSSEYSIRPERKTVEELYANNDEKDHLAYYFQLLPALEYNIQIMSDHQKTLDMLVDLCVDTYEDAD